MKKPTDRVDRVVITQRFMGFAQMQVCAVADASNEEILEKCNRSNAAGTDRGWTKVVRAGDDKVMFDPVKCDDFPGRIHFLVRC